MFETFEENGTYFVKGVVFVIAILNRDTLQLVDYVDRAFIDFEDAKQVLDQKGEWSDIAYLIQAKEIMLPIYRGEK